jgi:hypothetical protein
MSYALHIKLISDTTFGRGDGVIGIVDTDVEHDAKTGLPFVRGRVVKGLLVESCADILYAAGQFVSGQNLGDLERAARWLFGTAGSGIEASGHMHIGSAKMDDALASYITQLDLRPQETLATLTAIRAQTAMDDATGAPAVGSLRASRVIVRETTFTSSITFSADPPSSVLPLLAACAAGARRAGVGRNRGRGHIQMTLLTKPDNDYLTAFTSVLKAGR